VTQGDTLPVKYVNGKIRTSSVPYTYDIAKGNVTGHTALILYGRNPSVGLTYETVSGISVLQEYMTSAEQVKLLSTDTDDDGAPVGAGARTVAIYGLNAAYGAVAETLTMNGQTAVTADSSYLRVFAIRVITAGASTTNEGIIYLTDNGGTDTLLAMLAGKGQSNAGIWTVPLNQTLYVTHFFGSEASNKGGEIAVFLRPPGKAWYTPIGTDLYNAFASLSVNVPFSIPESTDIEFRAKAVQAGGIVTAGLLGWYEAE